MDSPAVPSFLLLLQISAVEISHVIDNMRQCVIDNDEIQQRRRSLALFKKAIVAVKRLVKQIPQPGRQQWINAIKQLDEIFTLLRTEAEKVHSLQRSIGQKVATMDRLSSELVRNMNSSTVGEKFASLFRIIYDARAEQNAFGLAVLETEQYGQHCESIAKSLHADKRLLALVPEGTGRNNVRRLIEQNLIGMSRFSALPGCP